MAYIECPKCGQRALSIATQCPRCGQEFLTEHPQPLAEEVEGPKLRVVLALAAALLAVLLLVAAAVMIVVVVKRHPGSDGLGPPPALSAAPDTALVTAPRDTAPSVTLSRDTAPRAPAPPRVEASTRPRDTTPAAALAPAQEKAAPKARDSSPPVAPAPSPAAPPPSAASPAASGQVQRYAKDWVNVRSRRRPDARVVRILNRGEAVMVDSLKQEWWRVLIDGKAIGYVYRGYLDTAPPRPRR